MKGWEDRLRLEKGVRNGGMVEEGEEEEEEEGEEAEEEERRRGWRRLGRRFISHVRRSRLTDSRNQIHLRGVGSRGIFRSQDPNGGTKEGRGEGEGRPKGKRRGGIRGG